MSRTIAILAALALTTAAVRPAAAEPITVTFAGSIDSVSVQNTAASNPYAGVIDGMGFSGSFTFDSVATDTAASENIGVYSFTGSPYGFQVTFDNGVEADLAGLFVNIFDDQTTSTTSDGFAAGATSNIFSSSGGAFTRTFTLLSLEQLTPDLTTLTSDDLQLAPFAGFTPQFKLTHSVEVGNEFTQRVLMNGTITHFQPPASTTAVPEPTSLLLFGTGALGLIASRGRFRHAAS